ncbi:TolC family outer membrane protein [Onishia niordana]|uniref:TolC family outer membrane protein n=1 Tax=Onishia niordana TaxID=2508711 RepID=UPI001F0E3565|nr:TolC family outer membrane protein [Halomonas niordiana]
MPLTTDFSASGRRLTRRAIMLPLAMSIALASQAQGADLLNIANDALENDASLASARASLQSTQESRDVASGDLLPQLNATGQVAHNQSYDRQETALTGASQGSDDAYNSGSLALEASQALYDAANARQVDQAESQIDQEALSLVASEQQLLFDVSSAYFEILRANDILAARQAQERAISRQLEQASEQFEVGLIAITDVEEARASYDQARAERITAQSDLEVSFEALERLTGKRYQSIESLSEDLPVELPTPTDRDEWVDMALEKSPLLKSAMAGVEVSRSSVEVAKAGRLPVVEAFANYNYGESDRDQVEGHDSSSQVGVRASLPLYTGGSTSAQIRQSTYTLAASQYDAEAQRRLTIQQVRSLYTQVRNDVATVEARRQAVVSNRSALDATRSGYEVGTRNIVDVLAAEQNLYDAISNLAVARYDYVLDKLELHQQAGTLDVQVLRELNAQLSEDQSVMLDVSEGSSGYDAMMEIGERPQPDA